MRLEQGGHRARHGDRAVAVVDVDLGDLAGPGHLGGPVDPDEGAVRGADEHLRAPAEPGHRRLGDAEGEGRGDGRVYRVAAQREDLDAGVGRKRRAADHQAGVGRRDLAGPECRRQPALAAARTEERDGDGHDDRSI
jgi:hypothetical protein